MNAVPLPERLGRVISQLHPGATPDELIPLKGGNSAAVSLVKVTLSSGEVKRYVVRTPGQLSEREHGDVARREFTLIQTMQDVGMPVQKPVYLEPRTDATPEPCYLVEYCEGSPELSPIDVDDYLEQYASVLARLHQVDHRRLAAISFLDTIDVGWPDTRAQGATRMRIEDIRAAVFSRKPSVAHANPPVVCHCDFWPGNLLWREGKLAAVIDWEESRVGEPLYDVAICRLDLRWILGAEPVERFTRRYAELTGHDLTDLPYWDLIAAMRPVQGIESWAEAYPHLGRPDVTAQTMIRDHAEFVTAALSRWA